MAPIAGNEHQGLATQFVRVLGQVIEDDGLGWVFGGVCPDAGRLPKNPGKKQKGEWGIAPKTPDFLKKGGSLG